MLGRKWRKHGVLIFVAGGDRVVGPCIVARPGTLSGMSQNRGDDILATGAGDRHAELHFFANVADKLELDDVGITP